MKKPPSKAELRAALQKEMRRFLSKGGEIDRIAPGETALEGRSNPLRTPLFNTPTEKRTPVDDVVSALEARRSARKKPTPPTQRNTGSSSRKKVIYDDFGEPLRTVWTDD
ncbi:conserved hypothetical protein [Luminiphilus syltensis NOR5-1B]|uniref:Transcriptional regulator SutA RNAP-binding domain-containing protein n=1 Tax=Luminiphilus syltensis NOR5-1B TaxID=565045 RepID=B8KYC1_9GAMM|nr:hypothetical protein [Luminiphilus syltensis]EED36155.1 conserved hypothetical protein [Luminiphilus syltensis NOR5-1B]